MARIVVISPDPITRAEVLAILDRDHEIRTYGDPWSNRGGGRPASEVRRQLKTERPDVLIFDAMVLLEGGRLADKEMIKETLLPAAQVGEGKRRGPSVLVLIEPGQEHFIIPCFDAGADDYSLKPMQPADLKLRVRRLVAEREGRPCKESAKEAIAITDDGRILGGANRDIEEITAAEALSFGRYEIQGILGRGGYGVVYRARDLALGRDVALKVLPSEMHDNSEAVTRFLRESTAISRLDHGNIVKFYEMGSYNGRLYFTMELVEGSTLKEIADTEAPLSVRRATRYIAGITRALWALNSLGLVHRDVKPENVLITNQDQVKLIDFGLVRIQDTAAITSQDDVLGTPYFMAPEYIRAPGVPDIRYDLYALGITYFQLLTGEYPFDGKNAAHVMERHLRCPPPRVSDYQPGVPPQVEEIVLSLLQKDPDKRCQSPEEVLSMITPLMRRAA